jgi:hypothetical protein
MRPEIAPPWKVNLTWFVLAASEALTFSTLLTVSLE